MDVHASEQEAGVSNSTRVIHEHVQITVVYEHAQVSYRCLQACVGKLQVS